MAETYSLEEFYKKTDQAFKRGDIEKLNDFFLGEIEAIEKAGLENTPEAAAVYNEYAGWLRGASRFEESLALYERALDIMEACGQSETDAASRMRMNLAGLYRLRGDLKKAESLSLIVCSELEGSKDVYGYVTALNNLSLVYQAMDDYERGIETYVKVLNLLDASPDISDHEIATTYVNMAGLYLQKGDLDNAEQAVLHAIDIFDAMEGENTHMAPALSMLGSILYKTKRFDEAARAFKKAMVITEKYFGKNIDFAKAAHSLAFTEEALCNFEAAGKAQEETVTILRELFGDQDTRTINHTKYLGELREKSAQ